MFLLLIMKLLFLSVGFDSKLDLAFVIDGSQVVTKENFVGFLSFTKAITASLNVSKDKTHVSLAVYGDNTSLIVKDQYNHSSIEHALDNVVYPGSLKSNLGEALLHIASKLYNTSDKRPNVTRVLVILTGSKCQDDITVPSNMILEHYKVKVFVIAVGNQYSHGQLNEVSSNPDSHYVYTFNSGYNLSVQIVSFRENISQGKDRLVPIWIEVISFPEGLLLYNLKYYKPRVCLLKHGLSHKKYRTKGDGPKQHYINKSLSYNYVSSTL